MNYYPYYSGLSSLGGAAAGAATSGAGRGLLGLFRGINFGNIVRNTQTTLGLINQAIPIIKQAKPMMQNAKTMFQVMNEFKKVDTPSYVGNTISQNNNTNSNYTTESDKQTPNYQNSTNNGPTFFL